MEATAEIVSEANAILNSIRATGVKPTEWVSHMRRLMDCSARLKALATTEADKAKLALDAELHEEKVRYLTT